MTKNSNITPAAVRAWIAKNRDAQPFTAPQICDGVGAKGDAQRRKVREGVRYSVTAGYLTRTEGEDGATYELSGNGMRRVVLTEEERVERCRERDRKRDRSNRAPRFVLPKVGKLARAARTANQAANTPASAKAQARQQLETSQQFEQRGGVVEVLPALWNRVAA